MFEETGTSPTSSCYWHFRTNNLTDYYYKQLIALQEHKDVEWIVIGEVEVGEVMKGEHFHVAIKMKKTTRESSMKTLFQITKKIKWSYYLATKYSNSTPDQFIKYVIKNGMRFEGGIIPKLEESENVSEDKELKNKNTIELYKERIRRGKANDWEWFQENDPKWTLSAEYAKLYSKYFRAGVDASIKPIVGELTHYWIFGTSGTGKSSSVEYLYPDRYKKIMTNEKWDGYDPNFEGHQIVHIDELNSFKSLEKGLEGLDGLKAKVDRNPFAVRKNYGVDIMNIRPKSFIITSNYTPSQLLSKVEERGFNVDIEAQCLYRKFKVIHVSDWLRKNRLGCVPNVGIFDFTLDGEAQRARDAIAAHELKKLEKLSLDEDEYFR